jgi:hypothetical protein
MSIMRHQPDNGILLTRPAKQAGAPPHTHTKGGKPIRAVQDGRNAQSHHLASRSRSKMPLNPTLNAGRI